MKQEEALQIFEKSGALMIGHFILTSGRHSNRYMQCAQVLMHPDYTEPLAQHIAEAFTDEDITMVVGPAMGGIIVAYEVARQLKVPGIFCERQEGKMTMRRGFSLGPEDRVLVVEDVVTTGGSVFEVMDVVRASGATIVGVGVLVDRSGGKIDFGVRKEAVLTMEIQSWETDQCPLCKEGEIEAVKPGSRK
ncbi:MAG: orotate phosphoribosyltransferase [Bacillota bacterium]|nr:orotate phosphoribosyltransferase [Bacillota bacterium]